MNYYRLCERCVVRNCRRRPTYVSEAVGFRCRKRVPIKDGFSLLELAMGSNPAGVMYALYEADLEIKEWSPVKGFKIGRIQKNGN